ncbi:DUF6522 family protein [Litorivita pollutaquae]|uniref:DUF6522 family protein n=1 Tax=Litorivita pollutaquae TaxID=2200892 RepID=UPI001955428B|nr:DUF6522 family protein [Litorivita pollutaquae]
MAEVERHGDQFIVDAQLLSAAFNLPLEETRIRMQSGQIGSLCEAGEDEDAGRWRLTFRHQGRALRLVVDAHGKVLSKSSFPVGPTGAATGPPPIARSHKPAPTGGKKT